MRFKWLVVGLLVLGDVTAHGCGIDCANYESKLLEPLDLTFFRAGEEIFRGQQEKVITWRDLFDPSSLEGVETEVCKEKKTNRGACWGEPFEISIYDNGIVVEKGLSSDAYRLHNSFPNTPIGVSSGMTKNQVLEILGRPRIEDDNLLEYVLKQDIDYGRISAAFLYFNGGRLSFIVFRVWKGVCAE